MTSKHAKPSVIELYDFIRSKKASSKACPVRFSGIPKAELLKIAQDLGFKMPAVKRADVKKGKQVKKLGKKLEKKLQKKFKTQKTKENTQKNKQNIKKSNQQKMGNLV